MWGEKKLSKSVFGYFRNKKRRSKKVPMAIKLEGGGGGKALMAWPLVEEFFLRLPFVLLIIIAPCNPI